VAASGLRVEVGAAHIAPALEEAARLPPQSEMMKLWGVESMDKKNKNIAINIVISTFMR
jgi:hypothetical protein